MIKKIIAYTSLPIIFVWLLITSFNASKWKPDSANELLSDWSWLNNWPKWLDIPLMKWINDGFKVFNEEYGIYFEIVNNFLLGAILSLKKFLVMLPWPLVIALVVAIVFFSSGRKLGTTVFVGICTFFIGFLHPKILGQGYRNNFHHANWYSHLRYFWNTTWYCNVSKQKG